MYTNTVVVQRHSVVMTKTDKIYKVRCTYDTASKNITFGMMPIRDPDMISITSAPEAPAPRISILNPRGQEVSKKPRKRKLRPKKINKFENSLFRQLVKLTFFLKKSPNFITFYT